jgi:hypothetical protein
MLRANKKQGVPLFFYFFYFFIFFVFILCLGNHQCGDFFLRRHHCHFGFVIFFGCCGERLHHFLKRCFGLLGRILRSFKHGTRICQLLLHHFLLLLLLELRRGFHLSLRCDFLVFPPLAFGSAPLPRGPPRQRQLPPQLPQGASQ